MPPAAHAASHAHTMQCMEIWGGNTAIDSAVTMPGLNVWVYARPYEGHDAGGDVHYVSSCATGRISRLMVADISGHGQKVADLGKSLRDLMRRYVNFLDQRAFVSTLNREFSQLNELGRFATAIVATYWAPTDYLVASNAGHPRPIMFRVKDRTWQILTNPRAAAAPRRARPSAPPSSVTNLPLGIDDDVRYDQFAVKLNRGDLVLMYTDSLLEAKSPDGRLLEAIGLLNLLAGLDPTDPRKLIRDLVAAVEAFGGGKPPDDDLTVIALAASGEKPTPTLSARFGSLVSFLQTLAGAWRKDAPPVPWPELSAVNLLGPFLPWLNNRVGGR